MLAVIDYGMGNLHSVSKALERIGYDYKVTSDKEDLQQADGLILPGVGAFPDAMKELQRLGLDSAICHLVQEGKPLLGICLGMQLLFEESEEGGIHKGLSLLKGRVCRFPGKTAQGERYKVPHMGWNRLKLHQPDHPVLEGVKGGYTYFVHSYYVTELAEEDLIASALYFERVPAIVGRANVLGTQFHPEKSGPTGMALLVNFCRLCTGVKAG
ncbi:Imidazole glycerol phosphate synthase subunit hisH [Caldalkalibacillus thermarum TA2.A1]|uniref:Imidazole glycerol phosphate synthase subunit HisH n=1 Tax=Caldalkalibacillus thermarum (strain TA2.A1) TaxID=986075 RepID=F5L6U4_CALTT|nr:imidazole glycerol phosphate synthase subunit HisH [Caldalkalibacillus thermarum]EGL82930.1 Imidazole glycerol phosphate synthase subunit hisH [Caldalkalibacillus thermarum TA2.A1]GGK27310.1 imidazole glycerol phosphate synthase subunit HisH [Caldalkalibacillus thermarum]